MLSGAARSRPSRLPEPEVRHEALVVKFGDRSDLCPCVGLSSQGSGLGNPA